MGQMERSGTEDLALAARLMYGHLLSNTSILSAPETSFVLIAGLIPQDVSDALPTGRLRIITDHPGLGEPPAQRPSQGRAERRRFCRGSQGREGCCHSSM